MINKKVTYSDKLLADKEFREDFEREYENRVVSEKIAKRERTFKSALLSDGTARGLNI